MATPQYKIMLLGDSGVGKTTTVRRFCGTPVRYERDVDQHISTTTSDKYTPTLGVDVSPIRLVTNHGEIVANLWEVGGDPRYYGLDDGYYTKSHGAIIMSDDETELTRRQHWEDKYSTYGPYCTMYRNSDFLQVLGDLLGKIRSQPVEVLEAH